MHHAPVLRHNHLANALCRAASGIPQAAEIVRRCAANCPVASQALLRGCLDAYRSAVEVEIEDSCGGDNFSRGVIGQCVADCVMGIADLSRRECSHVAFLLNRSRILPGIMLELMINKDGSEDCDDNTVVVLLEDLLKDARRRIFSSIGNRQNSILDDVSFIREASNNSHDTNKNDDDKNKQSHPCNMRKFSPLPRRRRIRRRYKTPSSQPPEHRKGEKEEWITRALCEDVRLAGKTRRFLRLRLSSFVSDGERRKKQLSKIHLVWGRVVLYIRALALLINLVGIDGSVVEESPSSSELSFVESVMNSLTSLASIEDGNDAVTMRTFAQNNEFLQTAICFCLLNCSILMTTNSNKNTNGGKEEFDHASTTKMASTQATLVVCGICLRKLLYHLHHISEKKNVGLLFLTRIVNVIRDQDATELRSLVLKTLIYGNTVVDAFILPHEEEEKKYGNVCRWAASKLDSVELPECTAELLRECSCFTPLNLMTFVEHIQRVQIKKSVMDSVLYRFFQSADQCAAIYGEDGITLLLKASVRYLAKRTPAARRIPLVLPLNLEALGRRVYPKRHQDEFEQMNTEVMVKCMCQFEIQVVYALLFKDEIIDSPFAIDPRSLPLDQVLRRRFSMLFNHSSQKKTASIHFLLITLISKHCPELLDYSTTIVPLKTLHFKTALIYSTPEVVGCAIRKCILSHTQNDPEGLQAERLFLQARELYPISDVDQEAITALLATCAKRLTPTFVTVSYSSLCKDPLILLKCTIKIWKKKGLRRIILAILHRLLESNEEIVRNEYSSDEVVAEYLTARDAVVLRCCLVVGSGVFLIENEGGGG